MKKLVFNLKTHALVAIFATTLLMGCQKDEEKAVKPNQPPQQSMAADFSAFSTTKSGNGNQTTLNYTFSAITVSVWNAILAVTLAVPVAAFKESFNHEAVYQKDGAWQWQYSVPVGLVNYTAKLSGQIVSTNVNWTMKLSQSGGFQDFVWFTGVSKLDASSGSWVLYKSPVENTPLVNIDWSKDANGIVNAKYTNVLPNSIDNGSYISYGAINEGSYNTFYDVFVKKENNLFKILYNSTTKEGRCQNEKIYKDLNWHCWDGTKSDVTCGN